jgi:hypothetical protein|tara:strand:- start:178 stop:387 length:210 start_codon:yes stop_codon:yes gene_type:complete
MNSDKIDINECEFGLWDDEIHYEDVQKHDEFDYEYKTDSPKEPPGSEIFNESDKKWNYDDDDDEYRKVR